MHQGTVTRVKNFKATRAFTLIELIVTVVIIGILAGIGLVAYSNITDRAQDTADKTTLESLEREIKVMSAFGPVTLDDISDEVATGADRNGAPGSGYTDVNTNSVVDSGDTFVLGGYTLTVGSGVAETPAS